MSDVAASEGAVLIFDGRCGFCTRCAEWLLARAREPVHAVPWQSVDLAQHGLTQSQAQHEAWWLEPDGRRHAGHRAAARALIACGGHWRMLGWLMRLPPLSWLAALGYWAIARSRRRLPGTLPACKRNAWDGRAGLPPSP